MAVQKSCGPLPGKPRSEVAFEEDSLGLCELRYGKGPGRWSSLFYKQRIKIWFPPVICPQRSLTAAHTLGCGRSDQGWLLFSEVRLGQSLWGHWTVFTGFGSFCISTGLLEAMECPLWWQINIILII